jgi:hypothetical protein
VAAHRLARARKHLHQVHAHGTAAQFQRAKDRVRKARAVVFTRREALRQAEAAMSAAC